MTNFELFELVTGYTLAITILGWSAIGLFVALPIWWFVNTFFGEDEKVIEEDAKWLSAFDAIQKNFSEAFKKSVERDNK
ncbi:hypothetical protein [Leptospira santarosai]|uniref:hypothetical protein n=1 Tax=Leptospira santarosai TaxID=28183 RepID=UPI0026E200C4|nr:hypothetical protein [Leptospira santarosai]MDO6383442.1 hypothetical protein [Leptospira santarosai]